MSALLSWRSLPYDRSKYLVAGTEIAAAYVPGTRSRFLIVETRGRPVGDRAGDVYYALRDAAMVSDDEVRAGKRSQVVGWFADPDEAVTRALSLLD